MPSPSKGARLTWRAATYKKDGTLRNREGWFIRDGSTFVRTGCSEKQLDEAQQKLAAYVARASAPRPNARQDPAQLKIADAVQVYIKQAVSHHAKPSETIARLNSVLAFFGETYISDITEKLCLDFVTSKSGQAAARRQLEDLRAAINYCHRKGYSQTAPKILLPPKPAARKRWLTRPEAARLLRAAWRMRQTWKGQESDRRTGQHIARFILVALYTGTRSAQICGAALRPTEGQAFIDLERGAFFRSDGTHKTNRDQPVWLPDRLLAHVRRWARTPVDVKTKARGKSRTIGRMISHDYVVEWQGEPVLSLKKGFRSAVEAAGLGWYDDGVFKTDVTPDVLRHTAAEWLIQNGPEPFRRR